MWRGPTRSLARSDRADELDSEEDRATVAETAMQHRLDRLLHDPDLLFDDRVVVVGVALEEERLAELEAVLGRERQHHAHEELRQDRERRHAEHPRERADVGDRGVLLFAADDRDGHDRRPCLERQAHEAETEVGELVALVEGLRDAAGALGEHDDRLVLLEEPARVVGRADDLTAAREEHRDEGELGRPALDHAAREARRVGVEHERGVEQHAVDRHLARVVRDDEAATRRHVMDASDLGAEIEAMKERRDEERVASDLGIEAERIAARFVQARLEAREARVELLAEQLLGARHQAVPEARRVHGGVVLSSRPPFVNATRRPFCGKLDPVDHRSEPPPMRLDDAPRRRSSRSLALLGRVLVPLALLTGCPHDASALETTPPLTSTDPEANEALRLADRAADESRLEEAEARYREFLRFRAGDPLVPLAHLGLGRLLIATGRNDDALHELVEAERSTDTVVAERARFYRGVALHLAGQPELAMTLLRPMLGRIADPTDNRLLLDTLIGAAGVLGDHVFALRALDELHGVVPEGERADVDHRIENAVERELRDEELTPAYDTLTRSGRSWRRVAARALRAAYAAGDMERLTRIAETMRGQNVALDEELATLVERASRVSSADMRVIGAILPLTGPARELGQRALRGLTLAAGLPSDGPQAPTAAELIFRDDGGDPERAVRAVDELVAVHRVAAIIGPLDAASLARVSERAQQLGVPVISLSTSDDARREHANVVRLLPTLEEELATLLEAASRGRNVQRIALMAPAGRFGDAASAALTRLAAARSLPPITVALYAATATSFGTEVRQVAAANPDAVFIADAAPRVTLIAPALAAQGVISLGTTGATRGRPTALLVPSIGIDAATGASAARYLQGAFFSAPFLAADAPDFATTYRTRFAGTPDVFAAYAHDAFAIVRSAVQRGARSRAELLRGLPTPTETLGSSHGVATDRTPGRPTRAVRLEGTRLIDL